MSATMVASPPVRVDVLGVHVSCIDRPMAVDNIASWIQTHEQHYVCITGVHGVMESQSDPALRRIHNESGLTTPDGMPLVWCAHKAGEANVTRVYGPDLMLDVCERGAREGWRMLFYGGADGVADELAVKLAERFPGLVSAGTICPPFRALTDDEIDEECRIINAANADIVLGGSVDSEARAVDGEPRRAHQHTGDGRRGRSVRFPHRAGASSPQDRAEVGARVAVSHVHGAQAAVEALYEEQLALRRQDPASTAEATPLTAE